MAFEAGADGALLLLRRSGDRLLLGRRDEALIAVGARDEDLAAVGADTARAGAAVVELSDVASLREIGGGVLERARPRRCQRLTWSRGMCCGNVTVLPPLCGVILLVGWPVVASDLMQLP